MEIEGLAAVDWSAPWLAPHAAAGRAAPESADWRAELNRRGRERALAVANGRTLVFDAADAAGDEAYEAFIARSGRVPTRANLHDLFNALTWLAWPRSKARLNSLQAAAIARDGIGARRGALRDAATLIDENAVLLVTQRADLVDALRRHDWQRLFVHQRAEWRDTQVIAFGHALIEKLVRPYKAITAHALHVPMPATATQEAIDVSLCAQLDEGLAPRALMPLPVLGIPGWCSENAEPAFYDDGAVFRPLSR